MEKPNLLDIVALLADVSECGLRRGDVGTVVEIFKSTDHHPDGYLIEFVNEKGGTLTELSVTDPQLIIKLNLRSNFSRFVTDNESARSITSITDNFLPNQRTLSSSASV